MALKDQQLPGWAAYYTGTLTSLTEKHSSTLALGTPLSGTVS